VQIWIALVQALSSVIIGAAVVYIAWRQWNTASEKLIIDLFDKRFSLYQRAHDIIRPITTSGRASDNDVDAFDKFEREASFLFGNEVVCYLNSLREAILRLSTFSYELQELRDSKRLGEMVDEEEAHKVAQAKTDAFKEVAEFYQRFPLLCRPYMRLDQRRH
jgi:hypothetical protein